MDSIGIQLSSTYQNILAATSDLITGLNNCAIYQANIEGASQELSRIPKVFITRDSKGNVISQVENSRCGELDRIISDNTTKLNDCIVECNSLLSTIGAIQFNGQVTYTSNGVGAAEALTFNENPESEEETGGNGNNRFSDKLPEDASWFAIDGDRIICAIPDPSSEDDFIVYDAVTGEQLRTESMMSYAMSYPGLSADEITIMRGDFDT